MTKEDVVDYNNIQRIRLILCYIISNITFSGNYFSRLFKLQRVSSKLMKGLYKENWKMDTIVNMTFHRICLIGLSHKQILIEAKIDTATFKTLGPT